MKITMKEAVIGEKIEASHSDLLTFPEAATYLRISEWTLRHWVCERKIRFVKLGRAVRFRKSHLDRFIFDNVHGKEVKQNE